MYHLRLTKALSYSGIVSATKKSPDVFVKDKAVADEAVATGYFTLVGEGKGPAAGEAAAPAAAGNAHLDPEQLKGLSFEDLKKLAADMGIDVKKIRSKNVCIEAIVAANVAPGPDTDEEGEDGNEVDYGEDAELMD